MTVCGFLKFLVFWVGSRHNDVEKLFTANIHCIQHD